jgi:thiol-disulfide isomerase/thioredoxin
MGYSDDDELFAEPTVVEMEPSEVAPDFALVTLDGATMRLSELRGRWVLINFWATWCAPCRDEMPYLDRLAATHPDRLTVLGVNMRERATEVAIFADKLNLRLPILLAPDDATLLAYNVRGLPISILVAPEGTIALRIAGPLTNGVIETIIAEN